MATLERRVQVLFDPEQYARLEREATRERTSVGAFIRDCVDARLRVSRDDREAAWARLMDSARRPPSPAEGPEELQRALDAELDEHLDRKSGAR